MTKTIYQKDPQSAKCNDLVSESLEMPQTIYPYEARLRASLGDALISFSAIDGVATIELPPKAIFSSLCGYDQLVAITQQITKETTAIKQLIIR